MRALGVPFGLLDYKTLTIYIYEHVCVIENFFTVFREAKGVLVDSMVVVCLSIHTYVYSMLVHAFKSSHILERETTGFNGQ